MNKDQIKNLMNKIRSYYPIFKLNDMQMKEWQKELEKYDEYDVLNALENYVNRGAEFSPKLNQLIFHLKTKEEKERSDLNKILIDCPLCKKTFKYTDFNRHYDKCLLIKCIINVEKKDGREVKYDELNKCSYNQLRDMYDRINPLKIDEVKRKVGIK